MFLEAAVKALGKESHASLFLLYKLKWGCSFIIMSLTLTLSSKSYDRKWDFSLQRNSQEGRRKDSFLLYWMSPALSLQCSWGHGLKGSQILLAEFYFKALVEPLLSRHMWSSGSGFSVICTAQIPLAKSKLCICFCLYERYEPCFSEAIRVLCWVGRSSKCTSLSECGCPV